ncbi:MAG TPA: hypothetical protein VHN37_12670 [Actinomycetota bacterium]|nr:hypothetical protein [Actinomycetota bacterium]
MKQTVIAALTSVLLLAACGGDDEPTAQATPTPPPEATTAPPASEAPASEAPASEAPASEAPASEEPPAGPTNGKTTPEEAAQAFVADWAELDRASASGYATQAAIDEAFSGQPPQAEFMGCIEDGLRFLCGYYYEGGALNVVVRDSDAYGFIVTNIFYVAD